MIYENTVEQIIWDGIADDFEGLRNAGLDLDITATYFRQLNLASYGVADIVSISFNKGVDVEKKSFLEYEIYVYELKKDAIKCSAVSQVMKYRQGLIKYLEKIGSESGFDRCFGNCFTVLIGKSLHEELNYIDFQEPFFYTYKYMLNGLVFKEYNFIDRKEHEDFSRLDHTTITKFI